MNKLRQESEKTNVPDGPIYALYLLGPVRLCTQDGGRINRADWANDRQLALFIYLVLNRDHPLTALAFQHQFWPYLRAEDVAEEIMAVSQTLSHILKQPNPILRLDEGYQLQAHISFWIDIDEFDKLLTRAANEPDHAQKILLLQQAVSLYRDDFLLDLPFNQKWITSWRVHFQQGYLAALQKLSTLYEQAGDLESARKIYLNALRAKPVSAEYGRSFIRIVQEKSSPSKTLRQCKRLISLLQNELEILLKECSQPLDVRNSSEDRSQEEGGGETI